LATISIIATVLNEAQSIDRLVQSLLSQSLTPQEIVIVDGGSTDGTWEKLQTLAKASSLLRVIRDESCNLRSSPGPIARGRNVAITASRGEIIACCDAGCSYGPEWLSRLIDPIVKGKAEYVLGGSCIDQNDATLWDIAAAPLMGIAISPQGVRKSCTARSMAFTKAIWERVGGFPEDTLLGEDTIFDQRVQLLTRAEYASSAMALYAPRLTYQSAVHTLARYSAADGALGVRRSRLFRMLLRCAAMISALVLLPWSVWPVVVDVLLEVYFAVERDRSVLTRNGARALFPRIVFSFSVPWVSSFYYLRATFHQGKVINAQNTSR
jgi:glycosyltransferase involved in cell wall biosynthesis